MTSAETRVLGDVATITRGTVPAKPTDSEDGVPFFGIAEISAGGTGAPRLVEPDEGKPPTILRAGDVVVALMSNIGQSALITSRHEGAVLGRECAVIRPAGPEVNGAWIYVWTQSAQFRDQAVRHASGSTMPRLSYRALSNLTIPVPPLERREELLRDAQQLLEEFDSALWKVGQLQSYLTELRTLEVELFLTSNGANE